MVLRAAFAADAHPIARCVNAAYGDHVERIGRAPGPMLDDDAEVVRDHDVHVLEREGRVVGVVVLVTRDDGLLLDNIAVDPRVQGQGIGTRLMDFVEARARTRGHASLLLYTHARMHENIAWYHRRGYEPVAQVRERGFDRVYLRKSLRAADAR